MLFNLNAAMLKKLSFSTITFLLSIFISSAERPISVFNEKNGYMSYEELTRNVLINSQNEKVVTENFNRALQKNDWSSYANEALVLGSLNFRSNHKDDAIAFFRNAITGFAKSNSTEGQAMACCAIALVYQSTNQADSAIEYFKKSIQLNHTANNFIGETKVRLALSKIFEDKDDHTSSLRNFKEALDILPSSSDNSLKAYLNNSYAEELVHSAKENEAMPYLEKALQLAANDNILKAIVYRNIGIVNYNKSDYTNAIANFEKSLTADFRLPALRLLRDTYLKQYASGKIVGDTKQENYFSAKYKTLKDSVENVLNSRMLSPDSFTMEIKEKIFVNKLISRSKMIGSETNRNSLEFSQRLTEAELERLKSEEALDRFHEQSVSEEQAKQEREDRLKELEKEKNAQQLALSKQELEREKQQRVILLLLSGVLLVTVVLVFQYNRYRLKKKSHNDLDSAFAELKNAHKKLRETQDQLIRSEKLASLGQMTAGIAHEIQNPLNFVLNFAESSEELLKEIKESNNDEERREIANELEINLKKIAEHGKRADTIVKNMLQHSRVNKSERTSTDLNKLIDEYLQLAYHGMRNKDSSFQCALLKNFDPNFPSLDLIQQDFSRVLLNLFNNAFYAIHQKTLKNNPNYSPELKVTTHVYGSFAFLTISDNGIGIPKDLKEKIFEPFFTTKPTGQGTGLGLSLSFEIIKNHSARMEMQSEEGIGTTFKIIFQVTT